MTHELLIRPMTFKELYIFMLKYSVIKILNIPSGLSIYKNTLNFCSPILKSQLLTIFQALFISATNSNTKCISTLLSVVQ
jgi:hypothetical protein